MVANLVAQKDQLQQTDQCVLNASISLIMLFNIKVIFIFVEEYQVHIGLTIIVDLHKIIAS